MSRKVQITGDSERDIFWLGTALQSLLILGNIDAVVKDGISEILGETIATLRRVNVSGNLLAEIERWANHFKENYGGTRADKTRR